MQTARQWMVTHEWMLTSSRQNEWIEGKGIFLWLAFYCAGLGGGLFLVSLFLDNFWGMALGWAIVVGIKGTFHILDLGKASRLWRMVLNYRTSWLSRGLLFVLLFSAIGLVQLLLARFLPGSAIETGWKILAGATALAVMGYTGMVLNQVRGVHAWSVSLLPFLFIACGVLSGLGITTAMAPAGGAATLESVGRWMLIGMSLVLVAYLAIVAQREAADNGPDASRLKSGSSRLILGWVLVLGVIVPAIVALESYLTPVPGSGVRIAVAASEILSGMVVAFYILKSGFYTPLVSGNARRRQHSADMQDAAVILKG